MQLGRKSQTQYGYQFGVTFDLFDQGVRPFNGRHCLAQSPGHLLPPAHDMLMGEMTT